MRKIESQANFKNNDYHVTWIRDDDLSNYKPVKQVYGVVFNDAGEILIVRRTKKHNWQIPGGTPEIGETLEDTLVRELEEEANVLVKKIAPLGAQKVVLLDGNDNEPSYQLRYVALLDELLPLKEDPDSGEVWERMFVLSDDVNKYITWGEVGRALFEDAIDVYCKIK